MNEDPNLTVLQEQQIEADVSQVATAQTEDLVTQTHAHVQVPEELKDTVKAVKIPDLSLAETVPGVQQHPPAHKTITGDIITLPDMFSTREAALAASVGKATDGNADAGRVFGRQDQRGRLRVQHEIDKAA